MPEIETQRLRLRAIAYDDLSALVSLWSDPDVMKYLPTGKPRTIEIIQRELRYMVNHWRDHGFGIWVIMYKHERRFIGYCGIQYLHEELGGVSTEALIHGTDVEIITGLNKVYWGKGIASEATKANLRYGFETIHLPRIIAVTHPKNMISQHILNKLGLRFDADIRYYGNVPHFVIMQKEFHIDDSFYKVHELSGDDRITL